MKFQKTIPQLIALACLAISLFLVGCNLESSQSTTNPWIEATSQAPWQGRTHHTAVVFKDRMWIMNGWSLDAKGKELNLRDVWSSADGVNWTMHTNQTPWEDRHNQTAVAYKGKLWVFGGYRRTGFYHDVWNTEDGTHWNLVTNSAPWKNRDAHTSVVFQDKMWILGGDVEGESANDVWWSTDGVNWIEVTDSAEWPGRELHSSTVFKDRIYLAGGGYKRNRNDVWATEDGYEWQQLPRAPWTQRIQGGLVSLDGRLWMVGGNYRVNHAFTVFGKEYNLNQYLNDTWSSKDGIYWEEYRWKPSLSDHLQKTLGLKSFRQWSKREHPKVLAFKNKIWVLGGNSPHGLLNDVWYLDP